MEVRCPHCQHKQNTKSKLKNITCSDCQRKFPKEENKINNSVTEEIKEEKEEEEPFKVKLD